MDIPLYRFPVIISAMGADAYPEHRTATMAAIDPMRGMISSYLASPQGQQMIQSYLSSPEGQNAICEYISTPQGRQTLKVLLPRMLDCLQVPPEVKTVLIEKIQIL